MLLGVRCLLLGRTDKNPDHSSSQSLCVILNWPERIKTQSHDDRDNCFQHFDSKGTCGMTVNNDIDDDSFTKHSDSHTRNSHRQSV